VKFILLVSICFAAAGIRAQTLPKDFVRLDSISNLKIDLRYATANNFTGVAQYPRDWKATLHPLAAKRLAEAALALQYIKPGWNIVVFDATRPLSIQKKLYDKVRGTPLARYVSSSGGTSMHNYGLALDCSIIDESGKELDMGTAYDSFNTLSEPRFEQEFLAKGKLTKDELANRRFLRELMKRAGLRPILNEWWHFEAVRKTEINGRFKVVE
jgi:D-alanyl-D-alanine dipeptidase